MTSNKSRRDTKQHISQNEPSDGESERQEERIKERTRNSFLEELTDMPDFEGMTKNELVVAARASFSGPLPHPAIMKGYEEALPGSADRIIKMVEEQGKHRRDVDKEIIRIQARDGLLGIICAFFIALVIIICGATIVIMVPNIAGAISGSLLGLSGIATVVGTFLKGTRGDWESKDNKD